MNSQIFGVAKDILPEFPQICYKTFVRRATLSPNKFSVAVVC